MNKNIIAVIGALCVFALAYFLLMENEINSNQVEFDNSTTGVDTESPKITPIAHASAVINWDDVVIYADPAEDVARYDGFASPDVIFVTHVHGDHLKEETLNAIVSTSTVILAPQSVIDELPETLQLQSQAFGPGETKTLMGVTFEAIASYNVREDAQNFHPKSRGDIGVVMEKDGTRIYFSGDTEQTPEMEALENIDKAFVAMNLPYTMGVEDAARAVASFAPKVVVPYHYRTPEGFSDLAIFESELKNLNPEIIVERKQWYED